MASSKYIPLIAFLVILTTFVALGRMGSIYILDQFTDDYTVHALYDIVTNLILAGVSLVFIKRYGLTQLAGMDKNRKLINRGFVFIPLYLVLLNALFADAIASSSFVKDILTLGILCLSIGYAEEYALRGFLQSYLIKYFTTTKKQLVWAVITGGFIFGILHLIKFDKGLYGELSQVAFASFIGLMFGAILLRTKRLWPLIVMHALIDFAAKIDELGTPFAIVVSEPTSLMGAITTTLLILPCFVFGWLILRKKTYKALVG